MSELINLAHDGLVLSALHDGEPQAPLVILVHGFPDTPHGWDGVVDGLLAAGFQVLRPWLRGYTPGSAMRTAAYDVAAVAADLLAWRELFDVDEVHLVGHDWGAITAMAAATLQPGYWRSLSLLAIPPFQRAERGLRFMPQQLVNSSYMLVLQSGVSPWLVRQNNCAYLKHLWREWSPTWSFSEDDFSPVAEALSHPDVAWAATRYYRALFTVHRAATRRTYRLARRRIEVPTLLLTGADDGCMQSALFDALVDPKCFPAGVRTVRLNGCGHFLQAEKPQAVLDELLLQLGV
ncbi:MAG: alpha/beta hydrolase [Moraxellaceae bacterium]|nr:alpha/beta hydrolase [Moraxellaceae bacterium]MDP1776064.1 alpha/beta hydrolase [Moraxellaceae bacterium]MDZ4297683.1 alpha/beta hydrolase [Moraxellaceae bacterium]MDZ4385956.1 alpha/beta hydrolase [Moraxellaceae bacterium]